MHVGEVDPQERGDTQFDERNRVVCFRFSLSHSGVCLVFLGNSGIEKITKNYCRVEKRLECVTLAAKVKFYKYQNLVGFPNPLNLAV